MQRRFAAVVFGLFVCVSFFAASEASAQVANLIPNSSLETASGSVPQSWTSSVWGTTKATFTYPTGGANTGTRYVKTQVTTAGTGDAKWFPTSVAVTPGVTYAFSDWYQSTVLTEIDLEYTLSTGSKSYSVIGSPVASASWKQFQATFTAPANASSLKIYHLIEAAGTLSVDDFSLTSSGGTGTTTPPVLTQVTQVATTTNDTTPDYVFSSTKAGTITYAGDCTSSKTAATVGNNTITFTTLAQGLHSNCTLSVKDSAGGVSNLLAIPSFTVDSVRPSVTINQAAGQFDPATSTPVLFTAIFSEPVADFAASDVTITGTANGAKTVLITGSGTTYAVAVSGITGNGTVIAAIPANGVHDAANNANTAATFTDHTVTYSTPVPPPPAITLAPASMLSGTSTVAYSQTLTANTTATGSFTWSISSGLLPQGLTLGNSTSLTNTISGTPTTAGTSNFSVKITNGTSSTTVAYTVVINPAPVVPPPPGLIQNGNFETANGTNTPQGWTTSYWGTMTPVFTYPVAGKSGSGAQVQISAYTSGDAKWVFPLVTIASSTAYQYTEDYSSDVVTNVTIEYLMSDGTYTFKWVASPAATSGWGSINVPITPPAGAVSFTVLHALTGVGRLTIDNASLTAVALPPQSSNLIQNGNLEIANGTTPVGWTGDYWGTMTPVFTYPVAGSGGGKAAQVQITKYTSGDAKWFFNPVTVSSNTLYDYSEEYNSNVKSNITIEYKKSDGTFDYEWMSDLPATSGTWASYSTQITVPVGVVSFTVLHALTSVGTLALDNASLTAEPASPFANGMVSFIFDDGLSSQYTMAQPILTAAGFKGAYYIITDEPTSGDTGYMTWAQIKALNTGGQEIGAHTRTHPYLTTLTPAQQQSEIIGSYDDLVAQGITPTTFVYPYGDVNTTVENLVKTKYAGARGSYFGLNSTRADHYDLHDIRLDASSNLATIQNYIDQAVADKRWLVFEIHDVVASGGGDYAITPAFFQSVVTYVKQKGATVATMRDGLNQLNP